MLFPQLGSSCVEYAFIFPDVAQASTFGHSLPLTLWLWNRFCSTLFLSSELLPPGGVIMAVKYLSHLVIFHACSEYLPNTYMNEVFCFLFF